MTSREAGEQRSPADRRLDQLLDDVRQVVPPAPGFAAAVGRRSRRQHALLRVFHVLAAIAETAPPTIAIMINRDRSGNRASA